MTIEEAIKHAEEVTDEKKKEACNLYDVKNYEESRECIWCSEEHRQLAEWLKDYKRLLDQQPCEDVISRQAELDGLANIAKAKAKSDAQKALMGRVMFFTEQLPSITPHQKYGKWIIIDDCEQFIAKCSECGRLYDSRMISKYPYCHCGAKMQESEETGEIHCNHTDTEIAKSFIEDVEAVKKLLPRAGSEDKTE